MGRNKASFSGAIALAVFTVCLHVSDVRTEVAAAQQVAEAAAAPAGTEDANQRQFTLPGESKEAREALEDFERYAKKKAWDRAFRSLEKFVASKPAGLVRDRSGFHISWRRRIWQALAELPPDGRDAYRLFYDGVAKKLLDEARGKEEQDRLKEIYGSYFASSVGDMAADRLGDLQFELGNFAEAAECWQAIVEFHPESRIPRVRLLTKSAIALARAGRWKDVAVLERSVRERFPGEQVSLGGKEVVAADHLARLIRDGGAGPASDAAGPIPPDVRLPETNDPLWQFRFFSDADWRALANAGQNWGNRFSVSEFVPPAASDGKRVYVNLLGYHFALDAESGKLAWRSGRFTGIGQKIQNQPYAVFAEQYGIAQAGDRVYFVSRPVQQLGQQGSPFRLYCVNAVDGKLAWSSESSATLRTWVIAGNPFPVGDRVFVCGWKQDKATELNVLGIDAREGKLLWSTHIGTHQADNSNNWGARQTMPSLAFHDGDLYVDTNVGAMVEVNAASGQLNWGFSYQIDPPDPPYYYYGQPLKLRMTGAPRVAGGTVYFKGSRSDRLYAIDRSGPKLRWARPVADSSMLLAADPDRLVTAGQEITAFHSESRDMQWSVSMQAQTGTSFLLPLATRTRIYQFSQRGIFELDKETGGRKHQRVFRGADLESLGGGLLMTPRAIVAVSNLAVTAYPVSSGDAESKAPAVPRENKTP